MKRTTKKLSGAAKDRFFTAFFAGEGGLDQADARELARRTARAVASIRVHRTQWTTLRQQLVQNHRVIDTHSKTTTGDNPDSAPAQARTPQDVVSNLPTPVAAPAFDPYVFGLVPVYQREGADGLLARLETITSIDHLRQMARTQQIALSPDLRTGSVEPPPLRQAIVEAVARRIADRRAAASG